MKKFFVVMTEYDYPVAVEEYQLRGRTILHTFYARDFLEAVERKNKCIKECENIVRLVKKKERA
jgi:hypothetical protein